MPFLSNLGTPCQETFTLVDDNTSDDTFVGPALGTKIENNCITYDKCLKMSNTKVSDKMTYANSADPDQTAPEGAA